MKLIRTILMASVFLSITLSSAMAQNTTDDQQKEHHQKHRYVWIIGEDPKNHNIIVIKKRAVDTYTKTIKKGFQQSGVPNFIISDKLNNAVFGIGGFVNFRSAYDWNNVMGNKDFVTSDIPMLSTPSNKQRLLMDASTTRLFFKILVKTDRFGMIESYVEADFRGDGNTMRLREAYVALMGFTFGQTTTTFVDLNAAPNTIDFVGPNAYTYNRNLMIRYQYAITPRLDFAVALEMPNVSATFSEKSAYIIPQRMPDIPFYIQYSWDEKQSHLRASGLIRSMNYYDNTNKSTEAKLGWGAMLSGNIALNRWINLFGQALYGEGVENYIQDLNGNGYDLVPNSKNAGQLQTLPTMGLMGGVQFNCTKKWQMNLAYSQVKIWDKNCYFAQAPDMYKFSQYVVSNIFYKISPAFNVGVEYLYGVRKNADNSKAHANRAQMMIQYTF